MQEKQILSRISKAEQRIVDLYHRLRQNLGGSISINDNAPVSNLSIGPVLEETYENGTLQISIDPYPGYNVYRAKIAMQNIDWPGYGYLYNWYAVTDPRVLANPTGDTGLTSPNEWRVSSPTDWDTLNIFAGGYGVAGGKLKSTLTSTGYPFYGWLDNFKGTDDYNFNALGGSFRDEFGSFSPSIEYLGVFWTTVSIGGSFAVARRLDDSLDLSPLSIPKNWGCSVRLVREATAGELLLNDGDTSDTSSLDPYIGNDGKTYVTVKIGTQIWLAQNLRETKYDDNSEIFNASALFGGNLDGAVWKAKGSAEEGAWTAYLFGNSDQVKYDPSIIKLFYNDILESTILDGGFSPGWTGTADVNGPLYTLIKPTGLYNWNKTHIKITPGYDVSDFPTINERSLLIERAVEGEPAIIFRPTKRDNTGAITIEDLNNYNDLLGDTSYVYVEILEYTQDYYSQSVGIGISNL